MNGTNWLCPSFNSTFYVEGKWTSETYSFLDLSVRTCGSVNINATCANQSEIDRVLDNVVQYSVYYINKLILPGSHTPVTEYLVDNNFIKFGKIMGGANNIFISDY